MVYEKFKPRDILAVLQLTDMDGCMINNNKIVVKKTQLVPTFYNLENIIVNSNIQKENIIERNLIKKRKTLKMVNLKKICNDKYSYQIYYFSRNIELVFFNNLNPIQEEKVKNALKFSKHNSTVYLQIINKTSPPLKNITYEKKYEESWNFIKDEENSLKRYSNFSLLLEFLDSLI